MKLIYRIPATLAATALLAPALCMGAQQIDASTPKHDKPFPRTELFLGYSYIRAVPTLADGNRLVWLNGGSTSLAYNFTRSFGVVTDFGGYNATQLRLTGPGANPERVADAGGTAYTFLFGPRLSLRKAEHFTPFVQVLAGGVYASAVTLKNCTAVPCTLLPEQGSFALTAGGGFDIKLSHHLALRPVQAEYLMTRFANTTTSSRTMQNDIRLSSGLVFRFGERSPVPPIVASNHPPVSACSADRRMVRFNSGNAVLLQAQAADADGDALTYLWSASDGAINSNTSVNTEWNLDGLNPGDYTAKLHVDDGRGGVSDCSATVTVEPAETHPSLTCSVGKSSVEAGDTVPLFVKAEGVDPQSVTWTTTNGHIDNSATPVALVTSKRMTGAYVVTARATTPRGESVDCQVSVDVQMPAAIVVVEKRLALHSIYFPTAEPTAEQPERGLLASQRTTLTALAADFRTYSDAVANSQLVLEGHADPRGSVEYNQRLSERRVDTTKRFLVEQGVPEGSIVIKALGEDHNLSEAEVADAVENNDELTPAERARLQKNMTVIVLASNRRVDVTLSPSGQHSVRKFPFNAKDSITLLTTTQPGGARKAPAHRKPTR